MTVVRSRRAGISAEEARQRPLYAKVLGLQYLRPSSLLCFVLFEGAIAVSALLALAELVDWWVVAVLPASVAAMVKVNDVVAGAALKAVGNRAPVVRGQASVPHMAHTGGPGVPPPGGAPGFAPGFASWRAPGGAPGAGRGGRSGAASHGASDAASGTASGFVPGGVSGAGSGFVPGGVSGAESGFAPGAARPAVPDVEPSSGSSPAPASEAGGPPDGPAAADEWIGSPEQRARQSAARRYE